MANRVTEQDKIRINELYLKYGTYAEVARQTGFAPTTVKKYIIPNFTPQSEVKQKKITINDIPEDIDIDMFLKIENFGEFCALSEEEKEDMKELWKEMVI